MVSRNPVLQILSSLVRLQANFELLTCYQKVIIGQITVNSLVRSVKLWTSFKEDQFIKVALIQLQLHSEFAQITFLVKYIGAGMTQWLWGPHFQVPVLHFFFFFLTQQSQVNSTTGLPSAIHSLVSFTALVWARHATGFLPCVTGPNNGCERDEPPTNFFLTIYAVKSLDLYLHRSK